ncbi:recombinase family protein [Rhizobium sp. TH2]|uniref:recombinase family protein n=1 Tax=Rhizobium sp. TH2 TaxID=2775403 RepID=UPI002157600F|nr:recombinase family protein [Rhizobium sp. TH2]UVC08998.1 recombinase family protein [Rhizobium sp. TH2]
MQYIAYYRVSTKRQARSGLGLDAQCQAIRAFLKEGDRLSGEFIEAVSGRKDNRAELKKAIALAKKTGASLLIAKLDRFSRRVSFIASMMESGVGLVVADMPHATDFQLHIFAALAQEERRMISLRTKAALAQARQRGVLLGANGKKLAIENAEAADQFKALIVAKLPDGWESLGYSELARRLNAMGIKTRTGSSFYPQTVKNYLQRGATPAI